MAQATLTREVYKGGMIPAHLKNLKGLSVGFEPVTLNQSRIVLTGKPGKGKSTLANSNPHACVIDVEGGSTTVADPKAVRYRLPIDLNPEDQAQAIRDTVSAIIAGKRAGHNEIETVVFDTIDELINVFARELCIKFKCEDPGDYGGGHGKGYRVIGNDIFNGLFDPIHAAGLGWCVLAHTTQKTVRPKGEAERLMTSLAVSESFRNALFRKCEHMLFLDEGEIRIPGEKITKKVGGHLVPFQSPDTTQRVIWIRTTPGGLWSGDTSDDIKARVPLPDKIIIPEKEGWSTLTKVYDESIATLTGEEK